jgi:transposase InsO family protein
LCRMLEIARSSFYRWRNAAAARLARRQAEEELAARIRAVHAGHDGTYGSPRITAELRGQGLTVNHKRVERVMRIFGIAGLRLRRKVVTTVPEPDTSPAPDLLKRDFTAPAPGQRYVGDITYLPTADGSFLYLATVLDLGKGVVGCRERDGRGDRDLRLKQTWSLR